MMMMRAADCKHQQFALSDQKRIAIAIFFVCSLLQFTAFVWSLLRRCMTFVFTASIKDQPYALSLLQSEDAQLNARIYECFRLRLEGELAKYLLKPTFCLCSLNALALTNMPDYQLVRPRWLLQKFTHPSPKLCRVLKYPKLGYFAPPRFPIQTPLPHGELRSEPRMMSALQLYRFAALRCWYSARRDGDIAARQGAEDTQRRTCGDVPSGDACTRSTQRLRVLPPASIGTSFVCFSRSSIWTNVASRIASCSASEGGTQRTGLWPEAGRRGKKTDWWRDEKCNFVSSSLYCLTTVVWHFVGFYCSLECCSLRESKQGEQPPRGGHWSVTGLELKEQK